MPKPFHTLPLRTELQQGIEQAGYTEMTPIQEESLPAMLNGVDVMGQAKTGSGKTAAFGLALLNAVDPSLLETQGLVLCPTRELAEQVASELRRLATRMPNTRILTLCGGRPYRDQLAALKHGNHVVVGTPGRIGKHLRKGTLLLRGLSVVVLDEADRMMDMGFVEQVTEILEHAPRNRQTLLFSATFPSEIQALSQSLQRAPEMISVASQVAPALLKQSVFVCKRDQRRQLVVDLLAKYRPETALVFAETRADCDGLALLLRQHNAMALSLHGMMEQRDRDDVLIQFSNGSASVLVATNVAARGIDIPALPMVIISELSQEPESHLHRIGRTGRAGEEGQALSIVESPRELGRLERIEALLGAPIETGPIPPHATDLGFLKPDCRTLLILAGRTEKIRKGDVLGGLVKDAGIPADKIGRIDLMPKVCAVAIDRAYAEMARNHLENGRIKNRRLRARLL
ncbi:MAG: ATP-dependent RNA helicase DbpA [Myxococcota bacterium]|nr:ATP-dependent RNA helicase DbpA [Myxococcota bacterium]